MRRKVTHIQKSAVERTIYLSNKTVCGRDDKDAVHPHEFHRVTGRVCQRCRRGRIATLTASANSFLRCVTGLAGQIEKLGGRYPAEEKD